MHSLTYACVLTRDIDRLGSFYRAVLQLEPASSRGAYMEFQTEPGIFALWSIDEFQQIAIGVAHQDRRVPVQVGDAETGRFSPGVHG